jgi:NAD(P)-dependent dehydrogenase (short-subunit alcohol dehydrogenase family)
MMESMRSLFSLRGKVAVVTGAAQGLGRAVAEAMAAHGASVVLADLDGNACEATAAELRDDGGDVLAVSCDVSDPAAVERLAEIGKGWRGGIDILVCNAGIQGPAGPLAQASDADWDRVFAVNLRGAARLANRLLPVMADRGGGSVVLMSSIAGLRGNRTIGLYGMSKAALSQLARNLAVEWGPQGIRVNAIAPGLIRTPLALDLLASDEFMARRLAMTPLRRVGEPHEVAGVAVLLAGDGGAFITGQTLVVDGGTLITD